MKLGLRLLGLLALLGLGAQSPVFAQCVSLTTAGSAVSQNFNTLANTGTTNNLTITGWFLTESGGGTADNEQYGADTGASNSGDTYSYGAAAATDRALGGLQSSSLIPIFGACFTNNTGVTLASLRVDYTGEQWRLGTTSRTDRIDFQYSTSATSLVTGSWTDVNQLDFTTPFTATAGARDGNAAANRTALTHTITPVSIANGATFWIRWTDFNASGSDDGLAVDDFSLTAAADPCVAISFPYTLPNNAPNTLSDAIACANNNGVSADTIDLNGQTVSLTTSFADYDGATGLPRVDSPIILRNGTITRSGSNQFRLLQVGSAGDLTVRNMSLTNGGGATYPAMGGNLNGNTGSAITLINTVVSGATVSNSFNAGGIFASGTFSMANCIVSGNTAGRGGGLALQNGPAQITNSVISGNVATSVLGGGAMYIVGLDATIINSTITGNYATASGATRTGGILSDVSGANLISRNSILWGNTNGDGTSPQIVNDSTFGSNTVSNSIVQGGQFGGLNSDPLFLTPLTGSSTPSTAGNFQLLEASPAIDAGANADVPADTFDLDGDTNTSENALDLAGNVRRYDDTGVADTGSGTAPLVDLGAYEKQTNSTFNPCAAIVFPYTLPGNAPATLITAIECANSNGPSADTIDLNGQTVTLTAAYADYTGATGLPQINTTITLQNGTISRSGGNQFRLLSVGASGTLALSQVAASNGYGLAPGAMGGGGAIYNLGALNIVGGQFSNNYSALDGGAIHNDGGAVTARFTVFSGNTANTSLGGVGGGLANSFGVVTLSNVLISGNLAVQGAGIYNNNGGTLTLNNSTIAGNSTNDQGGGLRNENTAASVALNNTLISGNESALFPATSDVGGSVTNNFSLVGGSPAFVAPLDASATAPTTAGDYRLADLSPAIDAGSNSLVPGIINTDLDGNPRRYDDTGVVDAGSGTAPIVDLGAYEKQTNSTFNPCAAVVFPYTLPDNAPATLITAIECANANGTADVINLNGQTVTLSNSYGVFSGATGLPQVTTNITVRNGTITRTGSNEFRFFNVSNTGNLTVRDMTLTNGGGVAYANDGGTMTSQGTSSTLTVINTTISGSRVENLRNGSAIYSNAIFTIINSSVVGGGFGRGAIASNNGPALIRNTLIAGNSGPTTINGAGGVYFGNMASATIENSTIVGNYTNITTATQPGGVFASGGTVNLTIRNSIIWGNRNIGNTAPQVVNATAGTNTVTNSLIEGGIFGALGSDPLFVTPITASATPSTAGDFRLSDGSPAVDAGANANVPADTFDVNGNSNTTEDAPDLAGSPRRVNDTGVVDTGSGTAPIVDIGAYEKQTNSPIDPCAAITFPYTLAGNTPAELITAIECANANGASADSIDFDGQIVTLTSAYASYLGATGLPQISTAITLENGSLVRSGGAPQFRLLSIAATGSLTLDGLTASGGSLSASDNAGAIYNDGGTLTIRNSTLSNHSAGFGGALYNSGAGAIMLLADSQLTNNSASQNGGLLMNDNGSVSISRSTVSGNSSSGPSGNGAIYNFEASLDIVDSILSGNTATTSVGAVQNFAGTVRIANSVFAGNSATTTSGAVLNNAGGEMTITNSTFSGNRAGNSGGALTNNAFSTLNITNSTFAGNNATTGGGIHILGATITTVTNSVVWGNNGNTLTGATITYSIIEGGFAGTGNLNVDPLFVAPVAFAAAPTSVGNYRVQDQSPAVDAGDNTAVPLDTFDLNDNSNSSDEAPDLDGNPRRYDDTGIADTGVGTAPIVDMGAFEKQTNSPILFPMDVDFCNLQFPTSFTAAAGSTSPLIYGRIFEDDNGVLTSTPGAHPNIVAQLGHGPLGSDPRGGNPAWLWSTATYNIQVGNDDEYQATFIVPFAPTNTQRSYTYRFSVDSGANYTYCDTDGNGTNGGLGFSIAALGTLIINSGGQPTISINDVALAEGDSGVTPFSFTVSLNGPSLSAVTFDIATADNTATVANGDYVSNSQTAVVIPAGQTSTSFLVLVNRDTTFEPNETFFVNLTNVTGANVGDAQGTGTIVNDDVDPCAGYTFPYTMTGNTPAELIQAINCANLNGASADTINLNGQTVTLTESFTSAYGSGTGLPEITTAVVIQNGTITRSSADLFRFFIYSGSSSLTLNNITLSNGNPEWDGGAIWGMGSSTLIINSSRIIGNYGNYGGAIFIPSAGSAVITNTLLSGNRASSPGGAIRNRGNLTLNNSTIAANFTTAGTEGGGGIANNSGTVVLNNTIVFGNESSSFPASNDIRGTFTANNSLVGVNPSFVNLLDAGDTAPTTGGDYRLAAFSLAVDAGSNSLIPGGVTTDLDGSPRRYNDTGVADTGAGSAPIVDIGAYEKQTNSVLPQADLAIMKTNGTTISTPGGGTVYTITASNAGPGSPGSATVVDTFPASLSCTWTCVGAAGGICTAAGAGNINDSVNLPSGGSVTYTASCTISASATGSLVNTATVNGSLTDPNTGNNMAIDTDTLVPQADVGITKTDGTTSVNAGSNTVYTIIASNAGPSNAPAATVADTFPAACVAPSWACAGSGGGTCAPSGTGNINESVNLPAGGLVTFTATCPISAAASGTLSNTATVVAGVTDPNGGNESATDTSTIVSAPVLSINSVTLVEGDSGSSNLEFVVTRSTTGTAFSVDYATADGSASAGSDYTTTTGTLSFTAGGAPTQTINVPITCDIRVEGSETFTLSLSNATGTAQIGTGVGTGTITDNDSATVQFAPSSVSQSESSTPMPFIVTLSNPVQSGVTLTVDSATGTAMAADFTAISGAMISFPADSTAAQTVNVVIANDALDEDNEQFTLTLSGLNATGNVTLPAGTATATGTIEDDDALPVLSVMNVSQPEGNVGTSSMTFTVNLTPVSGRTVSFSRATLNGTATAPSDYLALTTDTLTIPAGDTTLTIPVTINGDATFEGDETFTLALSSISNATPGSLNATGTIEEDDLQPTITTINSDLPDPSVVGQGYPVQVTVTAQSTAPLGDVTISDGTGASCTAALVPGTAPTSSMSCTLTSTTVGSKTLSANYVPANASFGPSSDTETHVVDAAATSLLLTGPATVRFNTPASYTATLTVNGPGSGSPAGTITVSSGAQSCAITLPTATPSCNLSFPTLGSRSVTAAFVPSDANYLGASSNPVTTLAFASTDLLVSKSNGQSTYQPNDLLVYTVEVENLGPDEAPGVRILDPVPAGLTNVAWTCVGQGGAFCPSAGGVNGLDMLVQTLPSGGRLVISYFGNVQGSVAEIVNVASLELPATGTLNDPQSGNNSATDVDRLDVLLADGFESPLVKGPEGSVALEVGELRGLLGSVAWSLINLDDQDGVAARVYVRVVDGAVEHALAMRDGNGWLRLGTWQRYVSTPTLRWTAQPHRGGWRVNRVWVD